LNRVVRLREADLRGASDIHPCEGCFSRVRREKVKYWGELFYFFEEEEEEEEEEIERRGCAT
jgi:hypothetical protein